MITWRLLRRGLEGDVDGDPIVEKWEGRTFEEIAPDEAIAVLWLGKLTKRGEAGWDEVVPDGAVLQFFATDGGAENFVIGNLSHLILNYLAPTVGQHILEFKAGQMLQAGFMSLFPIPPLPGTGGGGAGNFGFGGLRNVLQNNHPVPVVYGQIDVAGVVGAVWTDADSDGNEVIHYLLVLSEGPIEAIGNYTTDQDELGVNRPGPGPADNMVETLRLNNLNASDLDDISVSLRLGSSSQTVMPGFENIVIRYVQDYELKQNVAFKWTMKDPGHAVDLHLTFPRGLFKVDATTGDNSRLRIDFNVKVYDEFGSSLISDTDFQYRNKKSNGQFWWTYQVELPAYGRYQIHLTRTDVEQHIANSLAFDEVRVAAVNEVRRFALAYRNRALLGVTITGSAQISGGIPNTIVNVKGRKVYNPVLDVTAWTRNPAWCVRDWLLSKRYGLGSLIASGDIYADAWATWAEYNMVLIDPWTDAPIASQPIPYASNFGTVNPTLGGTWTPTDNWGTWEAEVTDVDAGISVTIDWTYTPDDEANGTAATYQTVHTDSTPQAIAFGLTAVANPGLAWYDIPGDKWRFRTLKEPRCLLDIYIDRYQSAWKTALAMCRTANAILMRVGSQVTVVVDDQKIPNALFSENANVARDIRRTSVSKGARNNVAEIVFLNKDRNFETDRAVVEDGSIAVAGEDERRLVVQLPGIVRRTQALRMAARLLRIETLQREAVEFIGGLDSVTLIPGRVARLSSAEVDYSATGRIAGFVASTSVTLDHEISFVAGKVYVYIERQQDGSISEAEFTVGSDTTTDTIAVAPFDADPRGNPFVVGIRDALVDDWLIVSIGNLTPDNQRRISAVRYLDEIFTDAAPPDTAGFLSPDFSDAPANVTDAEVEESVVNNRTSRLDLTWTASAGSPAAVRYAIWVSANGSAFSKVGETTGEAFWTNTQLGFGLPITFAIQPIAADGSRAAISTVTKVTYIIHRSGGHLVVFPPTMTGFAITPGSGNAATLSWDDLGSDADGYEIRIHTWHEGRTIYRGSSTSEAVTLSNVVERYYARAYNTVSGTRYYSPIAAVVESVATPLSPYTSSEESGDINFSAGGALENFAVHTWTQDQGNDTDTALLQISRDGPATWTSEAYDLGSQADTLVSVDFRILPYQVFPADDISPAMEHVSAYGRINEEYLNWKLFVETSNNGTSWTRDRIDNDFNSNIVKNKRYFRFRAEVRLIRFSEGASYPCLAMAVRCKFDLSREP